MLQALRLLKKDGLLEYALGRGLLVTRLEPLRIAQLYRVPGSLDALAAQLAAECRAEIPAALIVWQRCARHDRGGYRLPPCHLRSLGQPYIVDSALLHGIHVRRVMAEVLLHGESRAGIWDEHEAIRAAIRAGDGALAATLSEGHADSARQSLVHSLELALRLPLHAAGTHGLGARAGNTAGAQRRQRCCTPKTQASALKLRNDSTVLVMMMRATRPLSAP